MIKLVVLETAIKDIQTIAFDMVDGQVSQLSFIEVADDNFSRGIDCFFVLRSNQLNGYKFVRVFMPQIQ